MLESASLTKNKVKKNIKLLIETGSLQEAKILANQYVKIMPNDIEIYSINAVIEIMEGNLEKAENVLKVGLEKDPNNPDLLFNMSYLMDINKKERKAVEYFSKAKLFNPQSDLRVDEIISNGSCMENNNLKVIHGTMEIANQMYTITKGLKSLGVDSKTLNYYSSYLKYKSDYNLNVNAFNNLNEANIETKKIASRIISENDVFHFHFGTSFTLDHSDLPLLKELGKKTFMHHHGSDVRIFDIAYKNNPFISEKVKENNQDDIKMRINYLSKYINTCIVSDYEIIEYVKDYYEQVKFIPLMIDLNEFKISKIASNVKDKLLIVHAPTNAEYKGTKYIINAFNDLKLKYDNIEFKLVQGLPHSEALKIYKKADLIIDQILTGSYGVFAIESMAMGKPVVCWISEFMSEKYPKDLPIISANPMNIKNKLEILINNRDMLNDIGISSRKYVDKYHNINNNINNILNIYLQ